MGLCPELLDALGELGYEEPTPIQERAIPVVLAGDDLLGQAATGTGKTAAFALPTLQRWSERPDRRSLDDPSVLVVVPTRELAMQVSEAFHRYGRGLGARVVPIYGGQPIGRQLHALAAGVDVVVATPGRAIDHLERGTLRLDHVLSVVLDEADEMLDMGFAEDLDALLGALPPQRQTVLLSATMPRRIERLARHHLNDPQRIEISSPRHTAADDAQIRETVYVVPRSHKPAALGRLLDVEAPAATLVFCRTRTEVDQLNETMNGRGYRAEALHGGMSQEQRERVMSRLRAGTAELLLATDVAARGLDIDLLTHVVNFDVPSAPESYVHRIGRVGRAGRAGVAITLAEPREHRLIKNIEASIGRSLPVRKVPSVADLAARRVELTTEAIRERLVRGDLESMRATIDSLADEYDIVEVALAAAQLLHDQSAAEDDAEIPDVPLRPQRGERTAQPSRSARRDGRRDSDWRDRDGRRGPDDRDRGGPMRGDRATRGAGRGRLGPPAKGKVRLFVNAGRAAGVRPGDLVGAIAGESGLSGRDIGPIDIADRFSLVDVPANRADHVVAAMRETTIRGKRANVRRDRG